MLPRVKVIIALMFLVCAGRFASAQTNHYEEITPENVSRIGVLYSFQIDSGPIWDLEWSPNGNMLAIAANNTIILYDPNTWNEIRRLEDHRLGIYDIDFNRDGNLLVSAGGGLGPVPSDSTVRIWDVASGEVLLRISQDEPIIRSVAFTPDDTSVMTVAYDYASIRRWDVATGELLSEAAIEPLGNWEQTTSTFNSDGTYLSIGNRDEGLRLWQAYPEFRQIEEFPDSMYITFAPDNETIALHHWYGDVSTLTIIAGNSPVQTTMLNITSALRIDAQTFNHSGNLLVSALHTVDICENCPVMLWFWDTQTGEELHSITVEDDPSGYDPKYITHLSVNPEGTQLVSTNYSSEVTVYSVATEG